MLHLPSVGAKVAGMAASLLCAALFDVTATATISLQADQDVTASVRLDSVGTMSGSFKLKNASSAGFCAQLVVALLDTSGFRLLGNSPVEGCVNAPQGNKAQVERVVNFNVSVKRKIAEQVSSMELRVIHGRKTAVTDSLLATLFPGT
jgi:hypothetical protein